MARPPCAREIKTQSAQAVLDRLLLVDIRDDAFDAKSLGLTLEHMESSLHARFDDGTS
jgi:hypothetical protein